MGPLEQDPAKLKHLRCGLGRRSARRGAKSDAVAHRSSGATKPAPARPQPERAGGFRAAGSSRGSPVAPRLQGFASLLPALQNPSGAEIQFGRILLSSEYRSRLGQGGFGAGASLSVQGSLSSYASTCARIRNSRMGAGSPITFACVFAQ